MKTPKLSNYILAAALALPVFAQGGPGGPGPGPGTPASGLTATAEEIRLLTHMREEEKLAGDVYRFLYERWNLTEFSRIADSEQRHFAAMGQLLVRYRIEDPAVSDAPGVYTNETFTKLYAELTDKGSVSLKDALEVGVLIEKLDIADIEAALPTTAKLDIKRVLNNLLMGSYNHLAAFELSLEVIGLM